MYRCLYIGVNWAFQGWKEGFGAEPKALQRDMLGVSGLSSSRAKPWSKGVSA